MQPSSTHHTRFFNEGAACGPGCYRLASLGPARASPVCWLRQPRPHPSRTAARQSRRSFPAFGSSKGTTHTPDRSHRTALDPSVPPTVVPPFGYTTVPSGRHRARYQIALKQRSAGSAAPSVPTGAHTPPPAGNHSITHRAGPQQHESPAPNRRAASAKHPAVGMHSASAGRATQSTQTAVGSSATPSVPTGARPCSPAGLFRPTHRDIQRQPL